MNDPILITGCARSRTSMTAGIIDKCGAFGGQTTPPLPHNPKGQFENDVLRNKVKSYLKANNYDPLGQKPLPDFNKLRVWPFFREEFFSVLYEQGYDGKAQTYYKGAKMCLIWPIFNEAFPNAKWIFVRRKTEDIIKSCLRTSFMRKRHTTEEWKEWVDHHLVCLDSMKQAGLDITEISSDDLVHGKTEKLKKFIDKAGLEWNDEVVNDFIDPSLTRGI